MISVSKYNEIMEHIELTDEMRERILANVGAKQKRRRISRIISAGIAAAACAAIVLGSVTVMKNVGKPDKAPDKPTVTETQNTVPTIDATGTYGASQYSSAAELSENFGIDIRDITKLPFEVKHTSYSILFDKFAELDYYGGEDEECCFRVGRDTEDISGEYDEFTTVENETLNGCEVTLKGYDDDYRLASWIRDGHFYSVSLSNGTDKDTMLEIAGEVMAV